MIKTAVIVGMAAIIGSLIPVAPFFGLPIWAAVWASIALAGTSLFIVGAYKATVTVGVWWKSGLQLFGIGMVTALISYEIGSYIAKY